MRKLFPTLAALLCALASLGQARNDQPLTVDAVAARLEQHYNAGKYDSVFALFSPDMQAALPLDKTRQFLESLQSGYGRITGRSLAGTPSGMTQYRTQFERAVLSMNIALDDKQKIAGLSFRPYVAADTLPKPARNATSLKLPFRGEWFVVWGGDTKAQNYHVESEAQKGAFDIVRQDQRGSSHRGDGQRNEDYYAFGQEILAPCDGEVVQAVDGIKDNAPGTLNPMYVPGNSVILKTANNEYILLAHFRQQSVRVKQGQRVKAGQLLGLCGNSGNSSEPHLHLHMQHIEDLTAGTGIKCFFEKIRVNGAWKTDYSPVQNEVISNE